MDSQPLGSRGQLSLRNGKMGVCWPKKTDTRIHSGLEVKGLYEGAHRALVPIEANGNTPHSPDTSLSHPSSQGQS